MKRKNRCRILAAALAGTLLLSACAGGSTPTEIPTESDAPSETNTPVENNGRLELGQEGAALSAQKVTVKVTQDEINTVQAGIFGANVSWRGDGYGQWDPETDAPDEQLLQQLKDSGVTHLRYPGGIEGDYFHWNESVGDDRIAQIDPFSADYPTYDSLNGGTYIATFGPEEFLELCSASGTGATIQLNAGNGTAEEAADWVRFCLEKGTDAWSFCVGNEVCMSEERVAGMTVTCTPEEYVDFFEAVYAQLGDTVDEIEFGAIGITPSHPLCKYRSWDSTVLTALGDKIDFIDVHIGYSPYFTSGESQKDIVKCLLASSSFVRMLLDEEISIINACAGENAENISIQITEWGPIGGYSSSIAGGMYMASFLNTVLAEPRVSSACYLPLINHYHSANLLGALTDLSVTGKEVYWDNVNTYVFRWYAEQVGRSVLKAEVSGAKTFDSAAVGLIPAQQGISEGEASVYYDPATGKGTIFLLNKSYEENTEFSVQLPFASVQLDAVTELWNADCVAKNTYANPQSVVPVSYEAGMTLTDGCIDVITKPVSLLKLDFTVTP